MTVTGRDSALKWFDGLGPDVRHWALYQYEKSDNGFLITRSTEDDTLSKEASRTELSDKLSIFSGRMTIVAMQSVKRSPKGDYKANVELDKAGIGFPAPQQGLVQQPAVDVKVEIAKALADYKQQQELATLKKEKAELERKLRESERAANDPWNKLVEVSGPYLPHILSKYFPQQPGVAGITDAAPVNHQTTTDMGEGLIELDDASQQRLEAAVQKLQAAEPNNWLAILEKIADMPTSNPSTYKMAKQFLGF